MGVERMSSSSSSSSSSVGRRDFLSAVLLFSVASDLMCAIKALEALRV